MVQETAIAVARYLPDYRYEREACRFKTWLLNQASWRIRDQLKKRRRHPGSDNFLSPTGVVLDGMHRLCKAFLLNQAEIHAVQLRPMPAFRWRLLPNGEEVASDG